MSQVKERPILFSAPMVRAILEGRKTVTRRAVKFPFKDKATGCWLAGNEIGPVEVRDNSPFGQPGERLYVRETFMDLRGTGVEHRPDPGGPLQRYAYGADTRPGSSGDEARKDFGLKWKPSIHMPRAASRILLEITDVRVERLQDISEDQARAEGCFFTDYGQACFHGGRGIRDATECEYPASKHQQRPGWMWDKTNSHEQCLDSARNAFGNLWQSVGGDWNASPWVWVVEFKRVTP
ncbi:hypothetical protein [Pseudomonas gregormendelii]